MRDAEGAEEARKNAANVPADGNAGKLGANGEGTVPAAAVVVMETVKGTDAPLIIDTLAGVVRVAMKGTPEQAKVSVPVKLGPAEAVKLNCAGWPAETEAVVVAPAMVGVPGAVDVPVPLTVMD